MQDADGLIVGSPVKFLGIQIGHVRGAENIDNTDLTYQIFM